MLIPLEGNYLYVLSLVEIMEGKRNTFSLLLEEQNPIFQQGQLEDGYPIRIGNGYLCRCDNPMEEKTS